MRWLGSALVLALLAAVTALFLKTSLGNLALFVPPYRIDVSVNLALLALVLMLAPFTGRRASYRRWPIFRSRCVCIGRGARRWAATAHWSSR